MRFTQVSRASRGFGTRSRQTANPLRTISILAIVGLLVLGGLYVTLSRTAARVTHQNDRTVATVPRVALLSARRAPNTLSVITRTGKVSRAFMNIVSDFPAQSCVAVEWMGIRLGSVNPTKALIPASSTKLITAAVALEVLKPEFTYTTKVHGSLDATGSVSDLFFVGGGDPLIVRNEYVASEKYPTTSGTSLEKLADSLFAAGLRRVAGSVVGVDTRYDDQRFVDVWPQDFHFTEAGPLGSLVVDDGVVLGQITKPDDPAVAAATELQNLLNARGVLFGGVPRHDVLPAGIPELASIQSAPLTAIIQEMMVNSDNNTAELLLKEIGFASKGIGSTAAGLAAAKDQLAKWKLDKEVLLFDGSGLASDGRISCDVFMSLLNSFSTSMPDFMAIAGETGTIRDTFDGTPVAGKLRAKTGTLNGVKALVGYLPVTNSDPVIFSLLMNKSGIDNQNSYRPIWYSLADVLNKASASPSVEQLTP
jgi:D-alanyl-D-alanine carboxypeptidase/D-alanyl-D-alanine-endopeptidase (penicillin-binding protein 4)